MRAREIIVEVPVTDYELIGDFSKPGAFRDPEHKLVTHPVHIQKVKNFFEQVPVDFRFFMVNAPRAGQIYRKAGLTREWGEVTPDQVRAAFPEQADRILADTDESITVIYLGNYGNKKVIMTPWIMAHRIGHAIQASNPVGGLYGGTVQDPTSDWGRAESYFFGAIYKILQEVYGIPIRNNRMDYTYRQQYNALFNAIGTQRSSREGQIFRPYEFFYELWTQFLKKGELTFNPLPESIPYGRKAWGRPTNYLSMTRKYRDDSYAAQELLNKMAVELRDYFNSVLYGSMGKIFLM